MIAPLGLLVLGFVALPAVGNVFYSFFGWNGIEPPNFVGLANYARLFADPRFLFGVRNMGIMFAYIPAAIVIPLILAEFLRGRVPGWTVFRAVLYAPTIIGSAIMAVLFRQVFVDHGALNRFLHALSAEAVALNWIGRSVPAIHTTAFLFVIWIRVGFGTVYLLAAMSAIDDSLYEAGRLDGASWVQSFRHITIPSIREALQFWFVLLLIAVSARTFPFVFAFTSGGPGYATNTIEYGIYTYGFRFFQSGYASAWSTVLLLISLAIGYLHNRATRGDAP